MSAAEIAYVERGNLYVGLLNGRIYQIQKNTVRRINPHAVRVDCLDVTTGPRAIIRDRRLLLDAWSLTDFIAWLLATTPNVTARKLDNALSKHFAGSADFGDVLKSAMAAVACGSMKQPPQGEGAYFLARALASNPEGFAALREAWDRGDHRKLGESSD